MLYMYYVYYKLNKDESVTFLSEVGGNNPIEAVLKCMNSTIKYNKNIKKSDINIIKVEYLGKYNKVLKELIKG